MKTIIFSYYIDGHYIEYLHHIYEVCLRKEEDFVFLVPREFNNKSQYLKWPEATNISFEYIADKDFTNYSKDISPIKRSFILCSFLKRKVEDHKANSVFLINLMAILPFAPFVLKHVFLSGIIYKVYLYDDKRTHCITKLFNRFKYFIFSYSRIFKYIYILNDQDSAEYFNKAYHSQKFKYINDPYLPIKVTNYIDIRKEYSIAAYQKLFVHFGALSERKGTLDVLQSIVYLPADMLNYSVFVFAGKIQDDIKGRFYDLLKCAKNRCRVYVKDEFCSFEYIASLCRDCDAIVIPYHETAQSSGVLGYAAQFGHPVIAPYKGLIGKIVTDYSLGITINDTNYRCLIGAYKKIHSNQYCIPNDYCRENSLIRFQQILDW